MKVKVVKSENKFPRIMKHKNLPNGVRISMITKHGQVLYETILQDPNSLNIGYRQEVVHLSDWEDFSGEIILSN